MARVKLSAAITVKFPRILVVCVLSGIFTLSIIHQVIAQDCSCGAPCYVILDYDNIFGIEDVVACLTIEGGPELVVEPSADLTLTAGESITLIGGFFVSNNATFSMEIDPLLYCDVTIDLDSDESDACLDCDDDNSSVYPGATEVCDGLDNDCDGEVDEGCPILTCTSCHGGANPAPPVDTQGSSSTSATGVGAHQSHLGTSSWHNEITCEQCHVVPVDPDDPGHRDTALPAELTWGTLATIGGAIPAWNGTTCSGTYCHGSTMPLGGFIPTWTDLDGSEAACGTCHGNSTTIDTGEHSVHVISNDQECNLCHDSINEYGTGDQAAHIDGVLGVYPLGMSASPPGGTCGSKWTCTGTCHGNSHSSECW
jgi:predicted CxxxxCH...CXXCH cytochrome family protein